MKLIIECNYPIEYVSYDAFAIPIEYESKEKLVKDLKRAIREAEESGDDICFLSESFSPDLFLDCDDNQIINILTLEEWFDKNEINNEKT